MIGTNHPLVRRLFKLDGNPFWDWWMGRRRIERSRWLHLIALGLLLLLKLGGLVVVLNHLPDIHKLPGNYERGDPTALVCALPTLLAIVFPLFSLYLVSRVILQCSYLSRGRMHFGVSEWPPWTWPQLYWAKIIPVMGEWFIAGAALIIAVLIDLAYLGLDSYRTLPPQAWVLYRQCFLGFLYFAATLLILGAVVLQQKTLNGAYLVGGLAFLAAQAAGWFFQLDILHYGGFGLGALLIPLSFDLADASPSAAVIAWPYALLLTAAVGLVSMLIVNLPAKAENR